MSDPDEFSEREERVASMLAIGKTQTEIAKEVGIDAKTIRRWLGRDSFRLLVRSIRRGLDFQLLGEMSGILKEAVETLVRIAKEGKRDSDRIRACDSLLRSYSELDARINIEERLTAVEDAYEKARQVEAGEHGQNPNPIGLNPHLHNRLGSIGN